MKTHQSIPAIIRNAVLMAILTVVFFSCKKEQINAAASASDDAATSSVVNGGTIVDIALSDTSLTSLVAAVVKTNLVGALADPAATLTVFAPDNKAFSKLGAPYNNAENISNITDPAQISFLTDLLLYHVIGSEIFSSQIADGRSSATSLKAAGSANDNTLYISKTKGQVIINGASKVKLADIDASNGVIHKVNNVIFFPTLTVADVAVASTVHTALVAALVKTDLVGLFTVAGDYTVFAPTDEAFAKLPAPFNNADNINNITDPAQIAYLGNILRYHVTGSRYFAPDFGIPSGTIITLADAPGNKIKTSAKERPLVIGKGNNKAAVAKPANLLCTNGVVHVIDAVLLP